MNTLTKKDKLKLVLELCTQHNITAYELGKNTTLTDAGAHKILTRESKNPQESSLNNILLYIETKLVESNINDSRLKYKANSLDNYSPEEIVTHIHNNKDCFDNSAMYKMLIQKECGDKVIKKMAKILQNINNKNVKTKQPK